MPKTIPTIIIVSASPSADQHHQYIITSVHHKPYLPIYINSGISAYTHSCTVDPYFSCPWTELKTTFHIQEFVHSFTYPYFRSFHPHPLFPLQLLRNSMCRTPEYSQRTGTSSGETSFSTADAVYPVCSIEHQVIMPFGRIKVTNEPSQDHLCVLNHPCILKSLY